MVSLSAAAFTGARLKIEWAYRHLGSLNALMEAYAKTRFYDISVDEYPGIGSRLKVETRSLPAEIPLIIGDAVHNMRCALDYAWNVLARASVEAKGKYVFPVHKTRQNLEDALLKSPIRAAFPNAERFILSTVKPWHEGNPLVWSVARLDNRDKHNLLIPAVKITVITNIHGFIDGGGVVQIDKLITADPSSIGIIRSFRKIELSDDSEATFQIVFPEGEPFEGEPVLPTLVNMAHAVCGVVDAFINEFADGPLV